MQRGGGIPQRGGVGAVCVGERVAVADGVGQQRGAVPAQRDGRATPMQQQFPFPSRASPPHRRLSVGPPRLGDLLPTAGWPARREETRERDEEGRGGEENLLTWRMTCGSHADSADMSHETVAKTTEGPKINGLAKTTEGPKINGFVS